MRKPSSPHSAAPGGGIPVLQYWLEKSLSPDGLRIWQTLFHQSACLSCAWGAGGQKGGFFNEEGETLQRCAKSVEAIASELQAAVPLTVFQNRTIAELQQLASQEADRLGRLAVPLILRPGHDRYEPVDWSEVYDLTAAAFRQPPQRVASYRTHLISSLQLVV